MMKSTLVALLGLVSLAASDAALVIDVGTYSQDFNSIESGLPTGWAVYTSASASALGSAASFTTAEVGWGNTSPAFRNSANTAGLVAGSSATSQSNSANRTPSLSLGASFGNPGGSFNFNFSTEGVRVTEIEFDALTLRVGTNASTWSVQYGLGASPASWTTLGSYSVNAWSSTALSFDADDFGTALDNREQVWFRFVMLSAVAGAAYNNVGLDNFTLSAEAIPEPATSVFLGAGFCFLLYGVCRRSRNEPV